MKPALFEGHDIVLGAPQGWDATKDGECQGLPVMRYKGACVSLWSASHEERAAIASGANIWLHVFSGRTQPPVRLDVGSSVDWANTDQGFDCIISGDGHTMSTTLYHVERGCDVDYVMSFSIVADAQTGLLIARLVVWDLPQMVVKVRPRPQGLRCRAIIVERRAP